MSIVGYLLDTFNIIFKIKETNTLSNHGWGDYYDNNDDIYEEESKQQYKGIEEKVSDNGAGVILVENCKKIGPCVILFQNKYTNMYEEGGGNRDHNEKIKNTARRELKEESCNLFRLSSLSLKNTYAIRHHNYICYFVMIEGVKLGSFYENKKIISQRSNNSKNPWLEMKDIVRVSIDDFITVGGLNKQGDLKNIHACCKKNGQNKTINIKGRTKACIREAINNNIIKQIKNYPIKLKFNPNFQKIDSNNPEFLKETKSYWT